MSWVSILLGLKGSNEREGRTESRGRKGASDRWVQGEKWVIGVDWSEQNWYERDGRWAAETKSARTEVANETREEWK